MLYVYFNFSILHSTLIIYDKEINFMLGVHRLDNM